ncbi:MAG: peptidylprolyl isomerase [Gemmatimonadales bacterium]
MTRTCAVLAAAVLSAVPLAAQGASLEPIDRIVAVVGTTPILWSQLQEEINLMRQEGMQIPEEPEAAAAMLRQVLEQMVQEELLVQQALADTLVQVPDQQVQSSVDRLIGGVRARFGSDAEFRQQLAIAGFGSPEEYRRFFVERRRRELLVQGLLQSMQQRDRIRPVPPTEAELRAFFQATTAQQPQRPASVSFRMIVIRPDPTPVADAVARAEADSLRAQLARGGDFAQLARRFSDDSASAVQGGDLGWLRRGVTVREFEQVIFGIRPGSISGVFHSPFGYHIAQVQRAEPSEVQVRHILIAPEINEADRARALDTATAVIAALRAGASFDSLERKYHDPNEQSLFENVAAGELYETLRAAIGGAAPGQVLGPLVLLEGGRERYGVVRFDEARPEGEYTYDELRDYLRTQLGQQNMVARYVASLRNAVYVDMRL